MENIDTVDSIDYSVYKDCTPLFDVMEREPVVTGPPILQGLDNLEKLVYFNSPYRSIANAHDQFEGDLANQGQGLEAGIFPVWPPLQLEENVFLVSQDPREDHGFQFDELETSLQEPFQDVLIEEEADNGPQVCQDSKSHVRQFLTWNTTVRRCRTKRSGRRNMNGTGLFERDCAIQIHQGLDQTKAHTIATGSDRVVEEIPRVPSHANEGQEARRRRGRPRKDASPSLTRDSSNKRPAFVLPAGWTKKVVPRRNAKSAWRKDTYYIEDETELQFRSRAEVSLYLEHKVLPCRRRRRQ